MQELSTYLRMMKDILVKKRASLDALLLLTREQEKLLTESELDDAAFDEIMKKKDVEINRITEIDTGFQKIFDYIGDGIKENKDAYKNEILELQGIIAELTTLGTTISSLEHRNKGLLEMKGNEVRKGAKNFKMSRQTADKYYKNMIGLNGADAYFMDQKQ